MEKSELIHFILITFFILCTSQACFGTNVKKNVDEIREDTGETSDDSKDESLDIPIENETSNQSVVGPTCARKMNTKMHEIRVAPEKQYPFIAALMSHQDEYLCSGAVIGNGLIITSAKCSLKQISYALVNQTKAKKDSKSANLHVIKTFKFPTYNGGNDKDIGLIYTEKHNNSVASKLKISNATDISQIFDLEALGYGLNSAVGQTKELQYVGVENRDSKEGYFDCVETKVLTCFKDFGGPVIFDNDLVGVITQGTDECTKEIFSTYSVNKKMFDFVPSPVFRAWVAEKLKKNEESEGGTVALATYPLEPKVALKTKSGSNNADKKLIHGTEICLVALLNLFSEILLQ